MDENSIILDHLTENDIRQLAHLANNRNISDNLRDTMPYPYTLQDAEDFIELCSNGALPHTFAIRTNTLLCGVIGLTPLKDVYRFSAELGYWIGEQYWGKGRATEAVRLITSYGFDILKLARIQAAVYEVNTASMHVLRKNGFEKEGISKNAVYKNGTFINEVYFARLRG